MNLSGPWSLQSLDSFSDYSDLDWLVEPLSTPASYDAHLGSPAVLLSNPRLKRLGRVQKTKRTKSMPLLPSVKEDHDSESIDLSAIEIEGGFDSDAKDSDFLEDSEIYNRTVRKSLSAPLLTLPEDSVSMLLDLEPDVCPMFMDFFELPSLDKQRRDRILALSDESKISKSELEKCLELFFPRSPHHVVARLKTVCYLAELEKGANGRTDCDMETNTHILRRFPVLDLRTNKLLVQVRSSQGQETRFLALNFQGDTLVFQLSADPNFDLAYIGHLMRFQRFSSLLLDTATLDRVKRPLNLYMLYRNLMFRAATLLVMLSSVNNLLSQYLAILKPCLSERSKTVIDDGVLLALVQMDLVLLLNGSGEDGKAVLREYWTNYKGNKRLFAKVWQDFQKLEEKRLAIFQNYKLLKNYRNILYHSKTMSLVSSLLWATEIEDIKHKFAEYSEVEKRIHSEVFPNYKFRPTRK